MMKDLPSNRQLEALQKLKLPLSFPLEILSNGALTTLYHDASLFDWDRFQEAKASLHSSLTQSSETISHKLIPCEAFEEECAPINKTPTIGLVILAGGQATRMGLDSNFPKALLPVSPVNKKTLLQLNFEKAKAFYENSGAMPAIALFVSQATYAPIKKALEDKNYFGFDAKRVFFALQPSLPFLTEKGELLVSADGHIMSGPDGNGSLLYTLSKGRVLDAWQKMGIDIITTVIIDNPLIDPFYPPLIRAASNETEDTVAFAGIKKRSDCEKVGLFVREKSTKRLLVIEYSELEHQRECLKPFTISDVTLANISQCAFPLRWALKHTHEKLPWHAAKKTSQGASYYKMEQFLFDLLEYAPSQKVVSIDRDLYFAPIKNKEGEDSLQTAEKKFISRDRFWLKKLMRSSGTSEEEIESLPFFMNEDLPFELDPFWLYFKPLEPITREQILSCLQENGYLSSRKLKS